MLLTQQLLMQCSVLTEAELNWRHGGRDIKLCVCVSVCEARRRQNLVT